MTEEKNNLLDTRHIKKVLIGLGWDEARRSFLNKLAGIVGISDDREPQGLNLDLSVILFGKDGLLYDMDPQHSMVYHGNLRMFGAIKHHGDNRTGQGDGCDEYITIDLGLLPDDVKKIIVAVNITGHLPKQQDFSMTGQAYVTLLDFDKNEEIFSMGLNKERYKGKGGIFAAEIVCVGRDQWEFRKVDRAIKRANNTLDMFQEFLNEAIERSIGIAVNQAEKYREQ